MIERGGQKSRVSSNARAALPNAGYEYAERLIRRDWAWEFLRRNQGFREARARAAKYFKCTQKSNVATIIGTGRADSELKKWGCLFTDTPDTPAPAGRTFWDPGVCPEVIRMVAFDTAAGLETEVFSIANVHCRLTLCSVGGGKQHLLFQDLGQSLQLTVSGANVSNPVHLLAGTILSEDVARHHHRGLQCFQHLQTSGHLLPDYCAIEPRTARLRVVLQALDGFLAGSSHRDIAVAIFGPRRVDTDWDDPGRHLQDHTRRAVRRGRALMEGGYLHLLK